MRRRDVVGVLHEWLIGAGQSLLDGGQNFIRADAAHALALDLVVASVPAPARRAGQLRRQISVARVAGLPWQLAPAVDDYRRALNRAGEVHQEADLTEEDRRVGDDRGALAQGGLAAQVEAAIEWRVFGRAELDERVLAPQGLHDGLESVGKPLLVLHRREGGHAGTVQRDLLRRQASGGAFFVRQVQIRAQGHGAGDAASLAHQSNDVPLRQWAAVRDVVVSAVVGVPEATADPVDHSLVPEVERHHNINVRVALVERGVPRHHPEVPVSALTHLAEHDGTHQVIARRVAEPNQVARPAAARDFARHPRPIIPHDAREVRRSFHQQL